MNLHGTAKEALKKEIINRLSGFPEVRKVIIFGSFVNSVEPNDIDIAVFRTLMKATIPMP
jgi:predicted nucleotidyltransferase